MSYTKNIIIEGFAVGISVLLLGLVVRFIIAKFENVLSVSCSILAETLASKVPNRPYKKNAAIEFTKIKAIPIGTPTNIKNSIEPSKTLKIQYHSI